VDWHLLNVALGLRFLLRTLAVTTRYVCKPLVIVASGFIRIAKSLTGKESAWKKKLEQLNLDASVAHYYLRFFACELTCQQAS
jgi:hypothetical protein